MKAEVEVDPPRGVLGQDRRGHQVVLRDRDEVGDLAAGVPAPAAAVKVGQTAAPCKQISNRVELKLRR